jgi:hypothetical protein
MDRDILFTTLWGKKFYSEVLNDAMQCGPDPSNELILAFAIQKLLEAKRKSK